jgi:hypothetical protein
MLARLIRVRPDVIVTLLFGALWAGALAWAAKAGLRIAGLGDLTVTLALLVANSLVYRRFSLGDRSAALLSGFTLFFVLASASGVLSYLIGSIGRPFADPLLARADAFLRFDWLDWRRFVQAHRALQDLLRTAYASMIPQILICLVAFPLSGMAARNRELLACLTVALVPTLALFAFFPAESAWVHYHVEPGKIPPFLVDLRALRSGALPVLDLQKLNGLITFPSFHTAVAVLPIYVSRGTRCLFLCAVVNGLMILSTWRPLPCRCDRRRRRGGVCDYGRENRPTGQGSPRGRE